MKIRVLVVAVVLLQHTTLSLAEVSQSFSRRKRSVGGRYGERWNYDHSNVPRRSDRDHRFEGGYDGGSPRMSVQGRQRLEAIYGPNVVRQHYRDFEKAQEMSKYGVNEHRIPWRNIPNDQPVAELDKDSLYDSKLSAVNYHGAEVVAVDNVQQETDHHEHCNIHGLWMSSVAGAAIELLPILQEHGRIEIRAKIFDLPSTSGILTSNWTGNGMISPQSPTTITIVFQEHIYEIAGHNNEPARNVPNPKTAAFVGQCLVCENSPVLQGSWIVFSNTQSCASSTKNEGHLDGKGESNKSDTFHQLHPQFQPRN